MRFRPICQERILCVFSKNNVVLGNFEPDKLDPSVGEKYAAEEKKMKDEDEKNREWLKVVVKKHGWPGKSLVGEKGAHQAWLLVQHADHDREFQQECLTKMELMPKGEVTPIDIAFLSDRILSGTGKKQKYGTQALFKDGKVVPFPIEDEDNVDVRRKALGLEPLAEYLKSMEKFYSGFKNPDSNDAEKMP